VSRLLYGYDVRGGLYFDKNGTEEAEGGEGLGGGREEVRNQALAITSSSTSKPDRERGQAEAPALS